jgi:hypothetical protein
LLLAAACLLMPTRISAAAEDSFKDLQIDIPVSMKGWSGGRPQGGPIITFHVKGLSYMTSIDGKISSNLTWNLEPPITRTEAQSDPFKLVRYMAYLMKTGDHAALMNIVDPATSAKTLAFLNRLDVIKQDNANYGAFTRGGILWGFEEKNSAIAVFYYLEGPSNRTLAMERVKKVNDLYLMEPEAPKPDDDREINFFTAMYDTFNGLSKDITVTAKP